MRLIKSILIAFSMFSKIPVPTVKWEDKDMRYVMLIFPLIGVVIGALFLLWRKLVVLFAFDSFIQGAGFLLIPLLITGGIHLDGFCDTSDALASHSSKEEKARILKDPHTGAFAVISVCIYLICFFALSSEISTSFSTIVCFGLSFVISRSYAGIVILFFNCSSETGLAKTFSSSASRVVCTIFLVAYLALSFVLFFYYGEHIGIILVSLSLMFFILLKPILISRFDGISGDLIGWFISVSEIISLACIVIVGRIFEGIL